MNIRKTTISSIGKQQNDFRRTRKNTSIKAKEEKQKKQKGKNINIRLSKYI